MCCRLLWARVARGSSCGTSGAPVDAVGADGSPNMSGDVEHFVTLDGVRVDAIRDTEHVIIRSTVNTTDSDSETVVAFDESATVEVKLGAKIYARAEL